MRRWIWALGIVITVGVSVSSAFILNKEESKSTFSHESGLGFSYDSRLEGKGLSSQDKTDGVIFRAVNGPSEKAPLLVKAQIESGLRISSKSVKMPIRDMILDNSGRFLPAKYPEYQKISEHRFQVDGKDSATLEFKYVNNGEKLRQKLVLLVLNDDQAIYISMQARESDWSVARSNYFDPLIESIKL